MSHAFTRRCRDELTSIAPSGLQEKEDLLVVEVLQRIDVVDDLGCERQLPGETW